MADEIEQIAVVGMGCRFPGDGTDPESLWTMISNGRSAWSEFPADRMNVSSYYHPSGNRQGSICFQGAHFLTQDVKAFDSSFFSITAEEAGAIDPQQRMLLEVTVEALDNAGIDRNAIKKSETGVWVGSFVKDYEQIVLRDPDDSPQYGATGNGIAIMSNRISYFLDVNGPSMTIDTGCSASLVCVHNACQSLKDGETDLALAGGAGLILTPNTIMPMTALNFLSPDGKCFTFDARANGYGRGEGIGIVVLKRLSDAIRDNDTIRAVIRGSRVNQDGRTPGITLPSSEAQIKNIRGVYRRAGLDFDRTGYVECHGTGTQAGDVRELQAVSTALCQGRSDANPIYVGSIKTNIGHLEGCAGIAGLVKGILTVEHGLIPKHINFEQPGNPAIDFKGWKVKVPTENTPWPTAGLRRASINCFGFGGTNAHVILDDAAHYLAERNLVSHHNTAVARSDMHACGVGTRSPAPGQDRHSHVFVFSANERQSLLAMLRRQAEYLLGGQACGADLLENLAYTLSCRRTKMPWRVTVTAATAAELVSKLQGVTAADCVRASGKESPCVAFVFGGQGAQWFAMGRELMSFDIFSTSVLAASTYLRDKVKSPFDLATELFRDELYTSIDQPLISQPAVTALQVALVDLTTKYYGIKPSYVVGHSSGEIAAAYAFGAISREAAWELAYYRGVCAQSLLSSPDTSMRNGGMLAVGLSVADVSAYIDQVGRDKVVVACINSPVSVTLSGSGEAVEHMHQSLQAAGVLSRLISVRNAYHSHHMLACASEYRGHIAHLSPREPQRYTVAHPLSRGDSIASVQTLDGLPNEGIPDTELPVMFSSVKARAIDWKELTPDYWVANMVSPVLFDDAMSAMLLTGGRMPDVIVELSPHASLQSPVRQILDGHPMSRRGRPVYASMLRRNQDAALSSLGVAGQLWELGCSINMLWVVIRSVFSSRPKLLVDLPTYPWNHDTTHWHESHLSVTNRFQEHGRYDLIGRPTADSIPFQRRWRGFLRLSENPWMEQHQVQRTILYPASGMVAMAVEGARQMITGACIGIELIQFRIDQPLVIPESHHGLEYALNINKVDDQEHAVVRLRYPTVHGRSQSVEIHEFFIYSKPLNNPWREHGHGLLAFHRDVVGPDTAAAILSDKARACHDRYLELRSACEDEIIPRQFYESLDVVGMNYGPLFRNISSMARKDNTCTFRIRIPDVRSIMPDKFMYAHAIHPATLDGIFQAAFGLGGEAMVPSSIGSIYVSLTPELPNGTGTELFGYAEAISGTSRSATLDFAVSDSSWADSDSVAGRCPLILIRNMVFTAVTGGDGTATGNFLPSHHNLCSIFTWDEANIELGLGKEPEEATAQVTAASEPLSAQAFVLVPETMKLGLDQLCSGISEKLQCQRMTLRSAAAQNEVPSLCISLLEALPGQNFLWDVPENDFANLKMLIGKISGVLWVTCDSQVHCANPQAAMFRAFASTIQSEDPRKRLVCLDVEEEMQDYLVDLADLIVGLFRYAIEGDVSARGNSNETEFVMREGKLLVPRLVPATAMNALIERNSTSPGPELKLKDHVPGRALRLRMGDAKSWDGSCWDDDADTTIPLCRDEVVIKAISAALSDLDVATLGNEPPRALGTDVFGVVEFLGSNIEDLSVGDFVIGIGRGTFRDSVRCPRALVQRISNESCDPSLAVIPTNFALAHHALYTLGLLRADHVVLVHGGATLLGQAAIQMAMAAGAVTICMVANDGERKLFNDRDGVPYECILLGEDPRAKDLLDNITSNRGAHVILDLVSDFRDFDVSVVADGGRIVRFTEQMCMRGSMTDPTGKTFELVEINPFRLLERDQAQVSRSLQYICADDCRQWLAMIAHAVSRREYPELPDTLLSLAEGRQLGFVYFQHSQTAPIRVVPRPPKPVGRSLSKDGTYVFSGQGGLSMTIAKLLAGHGVKHIALLSRSGTTSQASRTNVAFLESKGVNVKSVKVDICDREALEVAARSIKSTMPPVRGLFQCAAVIRDSIFENMSYDDWQVATRPKTVGSWNLFEVFPQNMDFFIFLSSSAGVIGSRGQANYAAGNAYQDALARYIQSHGSGTRAVSLDLGPVLGAGMLAEDPRRLDMLKASGFFGVRLQDFETVVERAIAGFTEGIEETPVQVVMGVGTGGLIRQSKVMDPYWARKALFNHLNKIDIFDDGDVLATSSSQGEQQRVKDMLAQAEGSKEAEAVVCWSLMCMLARAINTCVDDMDDQKTPTTYGVDSLMAVGVRNWVARECDVDVSVFEILSDMSIADLSCAIVKKGRGC